MTYSVRNILSILKVSAGGDPIKGLFFPGYANWPQWQRKLYDYVSFASARALLQKRFCDQASAGPKNMG
jgi:hypothetical protein